MKKVIGYEKVQKLGKHGQPRIAYIAIYQKYLPIENAPWIPLEDVPPLDAREFIWKGKER